MNEFMDGHRRMVGMTADGLTGVDNADLAIQGQEGVVFRQAWRPPC